MPYCDKCDKVFASRQSLWKHRQRKHALKKENNIIQKDKFLANIIRNEVTQRGKDQPTTTTTSILPIKRVKSRPKALTDFKSGKEMEESEPDSDSENQSTTFYSDSEPEEVEDSGFMPDNPKELVATCIKLCKKVHSNMENYNKIVLILDKLCHIRCLPKEECDVIKLLLQEKIGIV